MADPFKEPLAADGDTHFVEELREIICRRLHRLAEGERCGGQQRCNNALRRPAEACGVCPTEVLLRRRGEGWPLSTGDGARFAPPPATQIGIRVAVRHA